MFTPLMELDVFVVIVAVVAVAVAATVAEQSWHVGATVSVVAVAEKPWRVAATAWLRVVTVLLLCRRPFNAQGDN